MARKSVFIAATGQHVGKTTTSIGLVAGLQKRVSRVGFIKPVGQRHLSVRRKDGTEDKVDRDAYLIRDRFGLDHLDPCDMSPIVIGDGYTRDFLDSKTEGVERMRRKVVDSFNRVALVSDYVVLEGTGHMGVGSIVGINNATIAKMLGVDVVLVASGGVGSAFDEIALNMQLCQAIGVGVRGVVLNKVLPQKQEMIKKYMSLALREWGVPLLGCIPQIATLASPSMRHLIDPLKAEPISQESEFDRLFAEHHLVATTVDQFYKLLAGMNRSDVLIITPAARFDAILGTVVHWSKHPEFKGGLVLTGSKPPPESTKNRLRMAEIPAIYTPKPTFEVMSRITNFTPKTGVEDTKRIQAAVDLIEQNVDFDSLVGASDTLSMACMPDLHMWSAGEIAW